MSDPEYERFLEMCAERCNCCPECNQQIPCGGVMAGGLCDEMCYCDEHRELEENWLREVSKMTDEDFI